MTTYTTKVNMDLEWHGEQDGMFWRSTVVGGLQVEIHKNNIKIVNRNGQAVLYSTHDGNRLAKMRYASKKIAEILGGK